MTDHDIAILLARVDERTASMHKMLAIHLQDDETKHKDFEQRIRKNESFKWILLGGAGVTSTGLASLLSKFFP